MATTAGTKKVAGMPWRAEHGENARYRHAVAVLPLGELARGGVPGAQGERLVVGVERERHRDPRPVLPLRPA